jgi:hypothetical protein
VSILSAGGPAGIAIVASTASSEAPLVTCTRFLATCVAAGLALVALPATHAQGATSRTEARFEILAARAPLAVSGDGAWRLHVDAHDVLHRVGLLEPTQEATVQLPPGVQTLAASADGRRIALSTNRQCTGLVDFGAHDADMAVVTWRPVQMASDGTPLGPLAGPWVAQMPSDCGAHEVAPPVAISADGRWVATPEVVVDAGTNQVVATLPSDDAFPLRLQFIDHDARLLIVRADLEEGAESSPRSRRLSFSVWDMASQVLVNDVEVGDAQLGTRASLLVDVSQQTGAVFFLDESAELPAHARALMQLAPDTCGAAPHVRSRVGDDVGPSFVVDPYGRWIAWARPLDAQLNQVEWDAGLRSELIITDMPGGRVLARTPSRFMLAGLVATPDGRSVFALGWHAIDATTGERVDGTTPIADADQLVRIDVGAAIAALPKDAVDVPSAGVCREPGEAPGARTPARAQHLLAATWSHDLSADFIAAPSTDDGRCVDKSYPTPFHTPDGFWFDAGGQAVRIDPATGAVAQALPTPRKKGVCSVVSAAGTGFFNATGDTLTWRPLAAATDAARRRIVERRPGWTASFTQESLSSVRVIWRANAVTRAAHEAAGDDRDVVIADYDAKGKRVGQTALPSTRPYVVAHTDADLDPASDRYRLPAPCHAANGAPIAVGFDWRAGPFGSWRGMTCGPLAGTARLIWWSGATIAPRAPADATPSSLSSIDGAIAVVADSAQIHVVNLALQREFAQIALPDASTSRVWVMANRRLVLVQSAAADGQAWLRAYALP